MTVIEQRAARARAERATGSAPKDDDKAGDKDEKKADTKAKAKDANKEKTGATDVGSDGWL